MKTDIPHCGIYSHMVFQVRELEGCMSDINREALIGRLAENLPELRKRLHITQTELSDMLGSSRSTIANIENKRRKMQWSTFLALLFLFQNSRDTRELLLDRKILTKELCEYFHTDGDVSRLFCPEPYHHFGKEEKQR